MDYKNMGKVMKELQRLRVGQDMASPNYVNDVAHSIGIQLTVDEVVTISDDYYEVE